MFNFKNANIEQREAITTTTGPVLIMAGPGTGKTFTLVQRTVYLIQEKNILPEQILIATFTEKAAKELITRISNELIEKKINVNLNEMYIGTFHSICLRLIKEHLEYTTVKKNYRVLDSFEQQYLIFQNMAEFKTIADIEEVVGESSTWRQASEICRLVNRFSEELVDYKKVQKDKDKNIAIIGQIMEKYEELLKQHNALDFTKIQTEAYRFLKENLEVCTKIQNKINYIMIDEYQDTNYIQEQLVFLLAGNKKNICVVGDDDQGLYRFRGATIRNILEFPRKFDKDECKKIALVTNYRSESKIVDFYNKWMNTTDGEKFKFDWKDYRYGKIIEPHKLSIINSPTVIKVSSKNDEDKWHQEIYNFIKKLRDSGKIIDLNQIAFLFNSVKNSKVLKLASYLEEKGISVYSPRSDMFFAREEVMLAIGTLLLVFPEFVNDLANRKFKFIDENLCKYYEKCITYVAQLIQKKENEDLLNWIRQKSIVHLDLRKNTDYAFLGLLYQMFEQDAFIKYLNTDLNGKSIEKRAVRNLAQLSQIISKFEYLHKITVFTKKHYKVDVEKFFNMYMRFLYNGGINEYEDDTEYAPSGCVSFLTIHQSKGMEFPIVIVGSLENKPRKRYIDLDQQMEEKYFHRKTFEPIEEIKYFDFWRLYYTAFSRAQNLLVLSCNEQGGQSRQPSKYFSEIYSTIPSYTHESFNLNEFVFEKIKCVNIKEKYSFTSHIAVYDTCAVQYKFFKELGFNPIRVGATVFGTLVHQTIEDIHRAVLRKEEKQITDEKIKMWFDSNYVTISKSEHAYLAQPQLNAALTQILNYVKRQNNDWSKIQDTEVEVGLVKENYILEGTIDLIKGKDDTVEIVDFKSEKKPNLVKDRERVEHYKKQLQVYAYLIEEKTGKKVSKMHLYYTGAESEVPTITFNKDKESIDKTIQEFNIIVDKIQNKDFKRKARIQQVCDNCDFRFYCSK